MDYSFTGQIRNERWIWIPEGVSGRPGPGLVLNCSWRESVISLSFSVAEKRKPYEVLGSLVTRICWYYKFYGLCSSGCRDFYPINLILFVCCKIIDNSDLLYILMCKNVYSKHSLGKEIS